MPSNVGWTALDAVDLLDARDEGRLSELVPASGGVYVWRRKLIAPPNCKVSRQKFCEWILELTSQPSARIARRSISHCVWTDGIQIGGGGLTEDKLATLEKVAASSSLRGFIIAFVESLSEFSPSIYIGEANDLRARVRQHLDGDTGLLAYITDLLNLRWQDLQFHFVITSKSTEVSDQAKAIQELLEMISQRSLAPFATQRPG